MDQYKAILKYGCQAAAIKAMAFYEVESGKAIEKFVEKGTKIYPLPEAELDKLEALAGQYCLMQAKKSKFYARMLKSQMDYLEEYKDWRAISGDFGQGRTPAYVGKVLAELKKLGY